MTSGQTGDFMKCRSCGEVERASEGYPCATCGAFVCVRCTLKGLAQCAVCRERSAAHPAPRSSGN